MDQLEAGLKEVLLYSYPIDLAEDDFMSTTSLKLPEELKLRAAAAAHDLGMTPHAFMVDAIRRAATAAEQRAQFLSEAQAARTEMLQTGQGYEAGDVADYLRRRAIDPAAPAPAAKPWRG